MTDTTLARNSATLDAIVRVSRVGGREGDSFISPDVQRKQIESYCSTYGLRLGEWYEELDVSGGTTNRKLLNEAIRRVESGDSGGIIVAKLDRFARNVREGLDSIERISNAGGRFICVEQQFDTGTPQGRFFLTLMLAFAELERENRKRDWKIAKREAIERGVHIGRTPTGYLRPHKGKPLVLDPLAWEHVYEAGMRRIAGTSWRELAEYLDERGVGSARGKGWYPHAVRRMLANPSYLGIARQGEHSQEDAHPAIFTREEFAAINRSTRARVVTGESAAAGAVLRQIAKCSSCGHNLIVKVGTSHGGKKRTPSYSCLVKRNGPACEHGATMAVHKLDAYVEARLLDAIDELDGVAQGVVAGELVEDTKRRRDEATYNRDEFLRNTTLIGILGADKFNETAAEYQRAVELAEMEFEAAVGAAKQQEAVLTRNLIAEWREGVLSAEQRATLLSALLDRVVVKQGAWSKPVEERVTIVLRGNVLLEAPDSHRDRSRQRRLESGAGLGSPPGPIESGSRGARR